MNITIIQAPSFFTRENDLWESLRNTPDTTDTTTKELLVLNELPFGSWIAGRADYQSEVFINSCAMHEDAIEQLDQLNFPYVLGTRPVEINMKRINQGFIFYKDRGLEILHEKQFIPNIEGYHEGNWFHPGKDRFQIKTCGPIKVAMLICTDVMFNEWARYYGRRGVDLICVPRATNITTTERWKNVLATAAIVSGAYVASSNRSGPNEDGGTFGGSGMLFSPRGELLAETSEAMPIITVNIDMEKSRAAKLSYPCNVSDLLGEKYFSSIMQGE